MASGGEVVSTPVDAALSRLREDLSELLDVLDHGGLDHCDDPGLVGVLQEFERFRNRLSLVDHRLVAECGSRGLADWLAQPTTARMLVSTLRVSPAEAVRRVRAAEAVGPRVSMLGEVLDPVRPHLAAAQRAGQVSPEQVNLIERALDGVDRRGFDPTDIHAGERLMVGFARTFGPQALKPLVEQVISSIDPDGTVPNDDLNRDRRHFTLRPTRDGAYVGDFRLTGAAGAKLSAVLGPLAQPRLTTVETDHGPVTEVDSRTYPQRMHDALEEICDRLLHAGDLPATGGTPATVIVTMTVDDLLRKTGKATTSDGQTLTVAEALRLAGETEIVPAVLTKTGALLDLGRTRRIATTTQTLGLIARDGGCTFPGCDRPPEWCERHHIVEWVSGGQTKIDNLTLLCRYHHHNFAERGWRCTMSPDGLPEWTPPRWVDRDQKPQLNHRILTRHVVSARSTALIRC